MKLDELKSVVGVDPRDETVSAGCLWNEHFNDV